MSTCCQYHPHPLLMVSVLAWNTRGAHKRPFLCHLKHLLAKFNPNFIALVETRLTYDSSSTFCNLFSSSHLAVFVPAEGLSGGIIVLWKNTFEQLYARCQISKYYIQQYNLLMFVGSSMLYMLTVIWWEESFMADSLFSLLFKCTNALHCRL